METIVNIGLRHLIQSQHIGCEQGTQMVNADDLETGLQLIARRRPGLVLVPAAMVPADEGEITELLRKRAPRARPAVIVLYPNRRDAEMTIYEWELLSGAYISRLRSIGSLRKEAQAILARHVEAKQLQERVKEIGFNNYADVQGRTFHVQTEVTWRDDLAIRTTVVEGGAVRDVQTERTSGIPDDLEQRSRDQHEKVLAGVKQGKYC